MISAMLYVEFPQVQHIDLGAIVYVLKSVAIVTSAHSLINDFCGQSHFGC